MRAPEDRSMNQLQEPNNTSLTELAGISTTKIYLALRRKGERSHMIGELVPDGVGVTSFPSARTIRRSAEQIIL